MSGDQMLQRRGLAADWASTNPILGDGEFGIAADTREVKIGDGVTPWNDLISLMDLLSRVAKIGDIMTGRLQLPELGVTESDTLSLYQDDGSTLGHFSAGEIYDNGNRVYSESYPPSGGATMQFEEFLSNGTFTAPKAGAYQVFAVGGGGGSGGLKTTSSAWRIASGGGGGGDVVRKIVNLTLGQSVSVTIGAGGTAGTTAPTAGGHGASTTFGSLVTALGGGGGAEADFSGLPTLAPSAAGKATSGGGSAGATTQTDVQGGCGGGAGGHAEAVGTATGSQATYLTTRGIRGQGSAGAAKPSGTFFPPASAGESIEGYGAGGGGGCAGPEASMQLVMDGGGRGALAINDGTAPVVGENGTANTGGGAGGSASINYGSAGTATGATGGSGYLSVTWFE